jgi:uncharacterized FlaG/YvyC family protein
MDISSVGSIQRIAPITIDPVRPSGSTENMRTVVAAVQALNKTEMLGTDRELQFARDEVTKRPVIRILSRSTGEVIDQIPSEQVLRMLADIGNQGKE